MHNFLDFEKPIAELEGKIEELRHLSDDGEINIADEVAKLQGKVERLLRQTYGKLSAWQKTQVARHPDRPHFQHYISALIEDFPPLSGDRLFPEVEGKIEERRHLPDDGEINIADEGEKLQGKVERLRRQTYGKLSAWQKTQVARHPDRPHFQHYISALIEDFTPLSGDRLFAEDEAIVGGLGRFRGYSVMVIGHEKGADIHSRVKHNFDMARPEGYRKAQRLMRMAERFGLPIVTLVDTAGAYPGIGAEERGQAEAIARSIETCLNVEVPLLAVIIGEGGSGGAIALAAEIGRALCRERVCQYV